MSTDHLQAYVDRHFDVLTFDLPVVLVALLIALIVGVAL